MEFFKSIGFKIAYNYLHVFRQIEDGEKRELPFNAKHHLLGTFSYQPINKEWQLDINAHIFGPKKIVYNEINNIDDNSYSDPYTVLNAQFTKKIKQIEVYFGAENILNFKQHNPIINPDRPFSIDFDAANGVWGPTNGIEAYIGIRLKIE